MDQEKEEIRRGIKLSARALGIDPLDLATAISYETAGSFNPRKTGPTTKYGTHEGFIQFGKPQARQNGVNWKNPVQSQLGPNGAVVKYLRRAGVKPGMGLRDIYSAINAGRVGLYNRSDAKAGGAPGTVDDKVRGMGDHRRNAVRFMGGAGSSSKNFTTKDVVDEAVDAAAGPFPPAPREIQRTTGPVANSDRDVNSRDTRKQEMDPNSLIARMMAAGGRQSANVEDMRSPQMPSQQGYPQDRPSVGESPEWQKAVETFMVHYNREPATDSDMEIVANLMKGNDLTNEDVQDSVLEKMGETPINEAEADPDTDDIDGMSPGEALSAAKQYGWTKEDGDPKEFLKQVTKDEDDPNISGQGGPSDAEVDPMMKILQMMGVK